MELNKLSIQDKKIFAKYLGLSRHELSVYAFQNIYIWKGLFDIRWTLIKDNLCVFFKDKIGCFLYLPPQAKTPKPEVITEVFRIMDGFNKNKEISRIENVEEKDLLFYQNLGYACKDKPGDYLCRRSDLVQLKGNNFKSKRAVFNYFVKNYHFDTFDDSTIGGVALSVNPDNMFGRVEYLPFSLKYRDDCCNLYERWKKERKAQNPDPIYQGMLEDNQICLKILLENYRDLGIIGRVVKINKKISAFTFGFKLNCDTFSILYEITDLSIKGLSQFIFRRFCRELTDYKYINIMDDSGLENLKRVKLSYRPVKLVPAYIVKRRENTRDRTR